MCRTVSWFLRVRPTGSRNSCAGETALSARVARVRLRIAAVIVVGVLAASAAVSWAGPFWFFSQGSEISLAVITQTLCRNGVCSSVRRLNVLYRTQRRAPKGASASLKLPSGLEVGTSVKISVTNVRHPRGPRKRTILRYWGCYEKVPRGEPHLVDHVPPDLPDLVAGSIGMADPTRLLAIPARAVAEGPYEVHISYLGSACIVLGPLQDFLEPLVITSPSEHRVAFDAPINVAWKPVSRAAGYQVVARGETAAGQQVFWENGYDSSVWRSRGVRAALRAGRILGSGVTRATIPEGIFGAGPLVLTVIAISEDVRGTGKVGARGWAESDTTTVFQPLSP